MSSVLPKSIERLSKAFETLPGIGPKSAQRLVFFLLGKPKEEVAEFGEALGRLKEGLVKCSICHIISEEDPCPICLSTERDKAKLLVVEETTDVVSLERTRFGGLYHVLGGQISPLQGVGPDDLTIDQLLKRLKAGETKEVILATDPSLEGEATALFIDEQIKNLQKSGEIGDDVAVTRLARGLPVGGDLEYADELTLSRALEGRKGY